VTAIASPETPWDDPAPRFRAPLPPVADVVVIGGGIVGVCTGWDLVLRGLRVVLCEKGRVAGEQSGRNWGWIRAQGRDPAELPLMMQARAIWAELSARLGPGLGYARVGVTYLARNQVDMARYADWLPHARAHDLDTRLLGAADLRALFPAARAGHWPGGLHTASDARAEPFAALSLIAGAAVADGLTIREGCAVRALDVAGGRIAGVVTEAGRITAPRVVLAGGAWSALMLRNHGMDLPQLSVLSSVMATPPMPDIHAGAAADSGFALRRRADGGYTLAPGSAHTAYVGPDAFRHARVFGQLLRGNWRHTRLALPPRGFPDGWRTERRWSPDQPGPFEALRILNPEPDARALAAVRRDFARAFPGLGVPQMRRSWAGLIDTLPDAVPVIDRVAALPGLVLGTGLSGHGFGIGPAVGRALAALALDEAPAHDLGRFRLARFTDGGRLVPGPSL
jgi:glycine/D-amino acid oxidase-like deaminating enzyme